MRKVLKWLGIGIGVLLGLVIVAAVILYFMGGAKLDKTRQVQPPTVTIPNDEASLARGKHMVDVNCKSCHGDDLSGNVLLDDPLIGTVYTANITGLASRRTDEDLVLTIRHAIGSGGPQIVAMPSDAFGHFSAEGLGAIISAASYVSSLFKTSPGPAINCDVDIVSQCGEIRGCARDAGMGVSS
jgi:mono/diheme cytochrome c family protein